MRWSQTLAFVVLCGVSEVIFVLFSYNLVAISNISTTRMDINVTG